MKHGTLTCLLLIAAIGCCAPLVFAEGGGSGSRLSPFRLYKLRYHLKLSKKPPEEKNNVFLDQDDWGVFKIHLGGLFQADSMYFGNAPQLQGNEAVQRATYRIFLEADHAWQFYLGYDSIIPEWRDLNVTYLGWDHGVFLGGIFSPVWGLSNSADTSAWTNLELPIAYGPFSPGHALGSEAGFIFDPFTIYLSFYTTNINQYATPPTPFAYFINLEYAPIHTDKDVFVIELSGWEQSADGSHTFNYAPIPEIQAGNQGTLIGTGNIVDAKNFWAANAAVGWQRGPWNAQSEYEHIWTIRSEALGTLNYDAVYLTVGYFLTGESRLFDFKYAGYVGITPIQNANTGAWEINTRVSYLNLSDRNIAGGNETDWTLGLSWWPVDHLRVQWNYIRAWALPNSNGVNQTSNFFGMRMQLVF